MNEKIFLIHADFFKQEGFILRLKKQLAYFRARIMQLNSKDAVQSEINVFFFACMRSTISDDIKIEAQLLFFDTLNFYAQQYRSVKTYENIVASFESNDLKQKLFCKFPVKAKLTYAETLFQYYSLVKNEEPVFSFEKTNLLIKAKYYLWTLYMHHIDGKTKLNNRELSQCLTILAFCLGELSRWFEPLYYLEKARSQLPENPNVSYARALILKTVKEKTCLNYNAVLVLAIIDYCRDAMSSSVILLQQRDQLKMLEAGERKFLTTQKQSIAKIRAHRLKIDRVYRTYNAYKKFCVDEQLFINEHSFFCNCAKATSDSLRVETKHQHTRIDWAKQFEVLIDMFVADFALARKNYYHSLDGTKIPELITKRHRRYTHDKEEKVALLKNSFRTLYSLLDQIGYSIFQVFGIDPEAGLKRKFPDGNHPKLYFLNMWDFGLLGEELFHDNYYLVSLYSISRDLNNSRYAALKEFRTIRNAMEHRVLRISDEGESSAALSVIEGSDTYTKSALSEKSRILMILTKSAIMSFTYLVRRQSKLIERGALDDRDYSNVSGGSGPECLATK